MRITALAGDKVLYSQTAYLLSAAALSLMRSTSARLPRRRLPFLTLTKTPPTCSVTAVKPGCRSPA
ncbi:hypothetical protein MJ390_23800 [Klebsiella pneumoniae]|nr:hypothetical protein MJ390_23800 [Klebsiella pneumoniae]